MPGIVGIIGSHAPTECPTLVATMVRSMVHEPFYTAGTRFFPDIGVYCGWVAHEGSFAARQSADSLQEEVMLLFSGECFPLPRCSSEPRGPSPHTESLLRLYEAKGSNFIDGLNGLFSGLLIDRRRRRALLFNDRYGSERIYYYERGGTTFFASEVKALLSVLPELRAFDDEGVAQFLTYGSTMGERTLFRNVRLLSGGSVWTFLERSHPSKTRYFQPDEWEAQPPLAEEVFESRFEEVFKRALPGYLASDTKIGISLTGGLDTRMIMACLPASGPMLVSYTFAAMTGDTLDVRLGRRVAQACGLEHHTLRIGQGFLADYGHYVDRTVFVTDGCAGALGAHELYLTAQARQLTPIRLTGNFGSEVLRSMSTFKPIGLSGALFDPGFRSRISALQSRSEDESLHPVTLAAFREIPWHLFGILSVGRSQVVFRTPYLDNDIVELAYRAPAASRASPRAALRLIEHENTALATIPTDRGLTSRPRGAGHAIRRLFAEATFKLDYLHKEGMPDGLSVLDPMMQPLAWTGMLGRHKFLPYRIWFRRELARYVQDVLTDPRTLRMPYWNSRYLQTIAADHKAGHRNYRNEIHAILTLEAAERLLVRYTVDDRTPAVCV